MATAFEISRTLISQGADAGNMGHVLESLSDADLTPVWGHGATGAELNPAQVVAVVLGATAADPAGAAAHVNKVSELIRADGKSLGEVLTKILTVEPHEIYVEEIAVGSNQATIRYQRGLSDVFYSNRLTAFTHSCVIRGIVIQAVAMKISRPTVSGWVEPGVLH